LAEYWHAQIRKELGITAQESGKSGLQLLKPSAYQGSRYSFGYPACPQLKDQALLMDLLQGESIGVRLSESYMLIPEQSTSALVFHHPDAYYFDVTEA
jgi:5-methyltetrahydrofolate--homocysteine methyltransferase